MKYYFIILQTILIIHGLHINPQIYAQQENVIQEWVQRYDYQQGSQQAVTIAVDDSCNVFITGTNAFIGDIAHLPMATSYATVKYNSAGVQLWVQNISIGGSCAARSLAIDDSSNIYVTGTCFVGGGMGFGTVKYSCMGILRWVQIYRYNFLGADTTSVSKVVVDKWHNVYVTGRSKDSVTFRDYTTIKYSDTGVLQWAVRYNGPIGGVDEASSLAVDDSGNVYVTGTSQGIGSQQTDISTVKYNSSGIQLWVQRYTGVLPHSSNRGTAIILDNYGNVYVTGSGTLSGFPNDMLTIKYNSNGVQQWVRGYNGGTGAGGGEDLKVDNYLNVYVTGSSGGPEASVDRATLKYNSSGVQQWVARYHAGPNTYSEGWSIALDSTNNVYVTGRCGDGWLNDNYLTIKYSTAGIQEWFMIYNGPANGSDASGAIAVDKYANVYVTGRSMGIGTGDDYATIKYSQVDGINTGVYEVPKEYKLYQNYPNPFNPITKIKFALPKNTLIQLDVFDVSGRCISSLINSSLKAGIYTADFDGKDFSSGIYFYRLTCNEFTYTKKMILVK